MSDEIKSGWFLRDVHANPIDVKIVDISCKCSCCRSSRSTPVTWEVVTWIEPKKPRLYSSKRTKLK